MGRAGTGAGRTWWRLGCTWAGRWCRVRRLAACGDNVCRVQEKAELTFGQNWDEPGRNWQAAVDWQDLSLKDGEAGDEYADAGVKGHDHTQPQEVRHETAGPKQC